MSTKDCIMTCFKQLIMDYSYDKITVNQICDHAQISRKTFYVHFQNKAAIVDAIVYNNVIEPMVKMDEIMHSVITSTEIVNSLPMLMNANVYRALSDDFPFYSRLCSMPGSLDSPLVDALINGIQALNLKIMSTLGYKNEHWKTDYIAYYYAAGNALLIQRWIRSGMAVSVEDLAALYDSMSTPFWRRMADMQKA